VFFLLVKVYDLCISIPNICNIHKQSRCRYSFSDPIETLFLFTIHTKSIFLLPSDKQLQTTLLTRLKLQPNEVSSAKLNFSQRDCD